MSLSIDGVHGNTTESADVHHLSNTNWIMDFPSSTTLRVEIINVSPEIATRWLATNRSNRRFYKKRMERYAKDILTGKWKINGETITFLKSNRTGNGQHRLTAIVNTGITVPCIVVAGIDDDALPTIDTGLTRSSKDVLGIEGLDDWDAAILGHSLHVLIGHFSGLPVYNTQKLPPHAIREFYLNHTPRLESSLRFIKKLPRQRPPIPHSRAFLLHYLFSEKSPLAADEFMAGLYTGEILALTDPVYQLRTKLHACQYDRDIKPGYDQLFACIKAWNMTRAGKNLAHGRNIFPRRDEAFPDIK